MTNILLLGKRTHTQQLADVLVNAPGYSVVEANTSRDARQLFDRFPNSFDLVIADIDSTEVHGLEFLADLRQIESPVSILIITKDKNRVVDAIRFGIAGYLVRPFPQEHLVKAVRRAMASDHKIQAMVQFFPAIHGASFNSTDFPANRVLTTIPSHLAGLLAAG